jgi:hypothetical protein
MASFYTYVIASLPVLQWQAKPPFGYSRFLEQCTGLIPEADLAVLAALDLAVVAGQEQAQPTLAALHRCETVLRNELVRLRAGRKKVEPQQYLRPEGAGDVSLHASALAAFRSPSLLDAEKMLDKQRWDCAEEAAAGHYFDFDQLAVFAYKLLLLLKWDAIGHARTEPALESALA